jgi:hypothetical protein
MGTLQNQPPRGDTIKRYVEEVVLLKAGFDVTWSEACDIVRTALLIQSADVFDEQLAGLGDIAQGIVLAIVAAGAGCDGTVNINERDGKKYK